MRTCSLRICHGDENTSFFHTRVKVRMSDSFIGAIKNADSEIISESEAIAQEFVEFYKNLLGHEVHCDAMNLEII